MTGGAHGGVVALLKNEKKLLKRKSILKSCHLCVNVAFPAPGEETDGVTVGGVMVYKKRFLQHL